MTSKLQETIQDIIKCTICLNSPKNPKFCPTCSAIFCYRCIERWIDKNPTCPACRNRLTNENLNSNLIVSNILNELSKSQEYIPADTCTYHGYERIYFCTECRESICPDCALLKHKSHRLEKLSSVFNKNLEIIKIEEEALKKRQEELLELSSMLEADANQLFKNKSIMLEEILRATNAIKTRLAYDVENRYKSILMAQEKINDELNKVDDVFNNLSHHYKDPPSSFVSNNNRMIQELQIIHKNSILDLYKPINTELVDEMVPPFEHRLLKFNHFLSGDIFTSRITYFGMTWEVRCGVEADDCFLNLKVLECSSHGKYLYMFTVINQNPLLNKTVEFDIPFQAGETFLIPNFFSKQSLIDEGFLLPENNVLLLQFSFKPQNYYYYSQDLKAHIEMLEEKRKEELFGEDGDSLLIQNENTLKSDILDKSSQFDSELDTIQEDEKEEDDDDDQTADDEEDVQSNITSSSTKSSNSTSSSRSNSIIHTLSELEIVDDDNDEVDDDDDDDDDSDYQENNLLTDNVNNEEDKADDEDENEDTDETDEEIITDLNGSGGCTNTTVSTPIASLKVSGSLSRNQSSENSNICNFVNNNNNNNSSTSNSSSKDNYIEKLKESQDILTDSSKISSIYSSTDNDEISSDYSESGDSNYDDENYEASQELLSDFENSLNRSKLLFSRQWDLENIENKLFRSSSSSLTPAANRTLTGGSNNNFVYYEEEDEEDSSSSSEISGKDIEDSQHQQKHQQDLKENPKQHQQQHQQPTEEDDSNDEKEENDDDDDDEDDDDEEILNFSNDRNRLVLHNFDNLENDDENTSIINIDLKKLSSSSPPLNSTS